MYIYIYKHYVQPLSCIARLPPRSGGDGGLLTGWLYTEYPRPHKSGYPSFINHRTVAAVFRSARHSRQNNKIDDKLCLVISI